MSESSEELLLSIAETVSDALSTPIEELPPLSQSVDLEGLEAIVTDDRARDVTVTFPYAGHRVIVHSDSLVYVRPIQNDTTDRCDSCTQDTSHHV
ncbi:HalOD1 output domain-containing protein [Halorubrum sp. CSM-61]|uniref:HalOD1 output domain-containing protein n=1 Tax=Halorubrum sp. CSM-61 TaxID=2485838 RepID=UPI0013DE18C0|nr:HalOD1 output domain-containing protein [Halorubrum sp. CSM-61]